METWKECGWGKCGKRFEPERANRTTAFCSNRCRQAAYRWRSATVTKAVPLATPQATVTRAPARLRTAPRHHPWGLQRSQISIPLGAVVSRWEPCSPQSPIMDDLSIPAFLKRA